MPDRTLLQHFTTRYNTSQDSYFNDNCCNDPRQLNGRGRPFQKGGGSMQNWTHCVLKWNLQNSEWNGWTDWNWLKLSLEKICIFLLLQRQWIWFLSRDLQTVYKRDTCTFAPFYSFNSNFLKIKCWGKMNTDGIFLFFTATILFWKKKTFFNFQYFVLHSSEDDRNFCLNMSYKLVC